MQVTSHIQHANQQVDRRVHILGEESIPRFLKYQQKSNCMNLHKKVQKNIIIYLKLFHL